jgi:iron complex transport system substrate-binding protein
VIAVGWAGAQALLALGIAPLALPEIERYRSLVVEPAIPPETRELGLRSEPNLELMKLLAPHFIVNEPGVQVSASTLERIAPVVSFNALAPGRKPLDVSRPSTVALAQRLCREDVAKAYLAGWDARMAAAAEKLAAYRGGPLCLVSDIFGNRALVFGANSLYQDVLDRVGIRNAFTGATSIYGHATVGLDVLAAMPADTRLCILSARVPSPQALMAFRPLWRALPMLRENRVTILSDILFYGGLPSADRFARLLAERLPLGAA